ncbi:MAG: 7-cyano-7-deazaguanine synthase [archaeon]|nr:7-cyano-7-deazaguanine synthase [archaeon]
MNGEFGVCVDGVNPSKMKKYGDIIRVIKKSKRSKKQKEVYFTCYDDKIISNQFPNRVLPSLIEDLLNISLATFAADRAVQRDSYVPAKLSYNEGRFFSRKIHLTVPVSNKEKWDSLKLKLEKAISFMTYDVFTYSFIPLNKINNEIKGGSSEYDSIALFSGGLDSFAGSYFLSKQNKPLFVSINHGNIGGLLSNTYLVSPIKKNKLIIEIKSPRKGKGFKESTQFSRSLVYLSMAVSLAIANSIKKIFIPENGVIANQIGLNSEKFGTRTVNPIFLNYFTKLINDLFNDNFEILNPFNYLTKGEVVKIIEDKNTIKKTVSCAHYSRFKDTEYCGMCMPCILRIISTVSNGIQNDKEISKYGINPFLINLDKPEIKENMSNWNKLTENVYRDGILNVLELIKFAYEIQNDSQKDLLTKHYEFYDEKLFKMYIRFSIEIIKTLNYFSERNPSLKKRIPEIKRE